MKKIAGFLKKMGSAKIIVFAIFAILSLLSFFLIDTTINNLKDIAKQRFQLEVNTVVAQAREKYLGATTNLRSLQGFFAGSEEVTRKEFYEFIKTSKFFEAHPGFSTIAYIKRISDAEKASFLADIRSDTSVSKDGYPDFDITPLGMRDEYWPILYISPEDEVGFLLGSDQLADPIRAENIARARDIGDLSLSGLVALRQGGNGAIIAAPLYKGRDAPDSLEERRQLFEGAVSISFEVDKFFTSFLSDDLKERGFAINLIGGRTGQVIPLLTVEPKGGFWERFLGEMSITEHIQIGENSLDLIFEVPVASELSAMERYEPVFLFFIILLFTLFILALILALQKIKQAEDYKNRYDFVSVLAHQFRTPLTDLRWILESGEASGQDEEKHKTLLGGVLTLNSIVQRMLLFIEMAGKGINLDKKSVSVEELYNAARKSISNQASISRLEFAASGASETVLVDLDKMSLALSYLIENALVYSPKDKKVSIKSRAEGGILEIIITDYGFGIPLKDQKKVFSQFFRASNASLGINYGSGVSIYMAKKIIEAHGGTIGFTSSENEGSVFTLVLLRGSVQQS